MRKGFALILICMFAGSAAAQTEDTGKKKYEFPTDKTVEGVPSEEDKEKARTFIEEANKFFNQERYVEAIDYYERGYKLYPHPNTIYNIAKCYEKMGNYEEAIRNYELYITLYREKEKIDPPELKSIEDTVKILKEKMFFGLPEITIDSDPQGADIFLDNKEVIVGQTPYVTHLDVGKHTALLKLGGYESYTTEFEVKSREPLKLNFKMSKILNLGGIKFNVNVRKARIHIDGKVFGVTPYKEAAQVEEGRHQILIEKERYTQHSEMVDVKTGQTVDVTANLYLENPPFSWRGYVGIASAVFGLGSIGTSLFYFKNQANKYFQGTTQFNTFKTLTTVGYITGGVLTAAGAGLLIWEFARDAIEPEELVKMPDVFVIPVGENGIMAGANFGF